MRIREEGDDVRAQLAWIQDGADTLLHATPSIDSPSERAGVISRTTRLDPSSR